MKTLALLAAAAATTLTLGTAGALAQAGGEFAKADGNNDGAVTFEEAHGVYNTLTEDIFNQADENKDGKLDEPEFGLLQGLVGQSAGGTTDGTSSSAPADTGTSSSSSSTDAGASSSSAAQ